MMAERGISLTQTVQRYVPEFEKRWNWYEWPLGDSWREEAVVS